MFSPSNTAHKLFNRKRNSNESPATTSKSNSNVVLKSSPINSPTLVAASSKKPTKSSPSPTNFSAKLGKVKSPALISSKLSVSSPPPPPSAAAKPLRKSSKSSPNSTLTNLASDSPTTSTGSNGKSKSISATTTAARTKTVKAPSKTLLGEKFSVSNTVSIGSRIGSTAAAATNSLPSSPLYNKQLPTSPSRTAFYHAHSSFSHLPSTIYSKSQKATPETATATGGGGTLSPQLPPRHQAINLGITSPSTTKKQIISKSYHHLPSMVGKLPPTSPPNNSLLSHATKATSDNLIQNTTSAFSSAGVVRINHAPSRSCAQEFDDLDGKSLDWLRKRKLEIEAEIARIQKDTGVKKPPTKEELYDWDVWENWISSQQKEAWRWYPGEERVMRAYNSCFLDLGNAFEDDVVDDDDDDDDDVTPLSLTLQKFQLQKQIQSPASKNSSVSGGVTPELCYESDDIVDDDFTNAASMVGGGGGQRKRGNTALNMIAAIASANAAGFLLDDGEDVLGGDESLEDREMRRIDQLASYFWRRCPPMEHAGRWINGEWREHEDGVLRIPEAVFTQMMMV